MTREEVLQAARTWIKHVTGRDDETVLVARDSHVDDDDRREAGVRSTATDFLTVFLTSPSIQVGQDEAELTDTAESATEMQHVVNGLRRATCSVHAYGSDAIDDLEELQTAQQDPMATEVAAGDGISITDVGPVTDMPTEWETAYVEHAQVDLFIEFRRVRTSAVPYVETVTQTTTVGEVSVDATAEAP